MGRAARFAIAQFAVIAIAVSVIAGFYIFWVPRYFDPTRSVFYGVLSAAALAGGYVAYQTWPVSRLRRWLVALIVSAGVTFVSLGLSMLIILNTVGA